MPLAPGSVLGAYEVLAPLGAGGMGEVWRARDPRLNREVAIKVLPDAVAGDPERLARFEREARALGALNHPNIAGVYGFEQSAGVPYLVMELVPGEALAGPMPVFDLLPVARQIADALEAAHGKGIIHRDLKPANIKLTPDGKVKVLDFGLAKATSDDPVSGSAANSPTMSHLATQAGVMLGTVAYMSPEQVRGKGVDRRTDVWAFGCVLYELLAGKPAFGGETISDIITATLSRDPDWSALPADTPPGLRRLLRRCIERDPSKRLRSVADAMLELDDPTPVTAATPRRGSMVAWVIAALGVSAAAAIGVVHFRETPPEPVLNRFFLKPPANSTGVSYPSVSPDGRKVAFTARIDGQEQLFVHSLDSLTPQAFPGTAGAILPFWSPDGAFIGFSGGGKLKKVAASGGAPQTLCDADVLGHWGATWNRDGTIVFAYGVRGPLFRVSASGGAPVPVTTMAPGDVSHRFPQFLPDGKHFLYYNLTEPDEKSAVLIASLDGRLPSTGHKQVMIGTSFASFVHGRLLFERGSTLLAQAFDPESQALSGEPIALVQEIETAGTTRGWSTFAVAASTLVYRTGLSRDAVQLTLLDRAGKTLRTIDEPGMFRLSPDEKHLATIRREGRNSDIWVVDLERNTSLRLTFEGVHPTAFTWSADGNRIAYASGGAIYATASRGGGSQELLWKGQPEARPVHWSPDGRHLLCWAIGANTGNDLYILSLDGERKLTSFAATPADEQDGRFSPDGKWISYTQGLSTNVAAFPGGHPKWQLAGLSMGSRWRKDGNELFYLGGQLMPSAIDVTVSGQTLTFGTPRTLLTLSILPRSGFPFDVVAGGQQFLMQISPPSLASSPLAVVTDWPALAGR